MFAINQKHIIKVPCERNGLSQDWHAFGAESSATEIIGNQEQA